MADIMAGIFNLDDFKGSQELNHLRLCAILKIRLFLLTNNLWPLWVTDFVHSFTRRQTETSALAKVAEGGKVLSVAGSHFTVAVLRTVLLRWRQSALGQLLVLVALDTGLCRRRSNCRAAAQKRFQTGGYLGACAAWKPARLSSFLVRSTSIIDAVLPPLHFARQRSHIQSKDNSQCINVRHFWL